MGTPAAVLGDKIVGICATHLMPNPATGIPQPMPPLPFSAPLTIGCEPTVLIAGAPAAVSGAQGMCAPPHVGLHPADPYMAPPMQLGVVMEGSPTVLIGGKPAARTGSAAMCCAPNSGNVIGSATTVMIA